MSVGNENNKISKNKNHFLVVFLITLSVIPAFWTATYFETKQSLDNELHIASNMQSSLNSLMREIRQSLEVYSLELNTIRSFIYSTGIENISHDLFHTYSKHSEFERNYPGARGFGFIRHVDIGQESAFIDQASQDRNSHFKLRFLEEHANSRFIIQYIEPEYKNFKAIGLDIGSEGHRRSAAMAAARQNVQTLTAPITLVQADAKVKHGFLLLLPVFDLNILGSQGNEKDVVGWTYAPLSIDEIIAAIERKKSNLYLKIADVTSSNHIDFFESQLTQTAPLGNNQSYSAELSLFGREWEMTVSPTPAYLSSLSLVSPQETYYKVLGFFLLGMLFLWNILYVVRKHFVSLRQKTELAAVVENGIEGMVGLDQQFCLKYWNDAAKSLFGFNEASQGKPLLDWLIGTYSADYLIDIFNRVSKGEAIKRFEVTLSDASKNNEKKLHLNFQPIFQESLFLGANVSMVDVSEVQALQRLLEEKNTLLKDRLNQQGNQLKKSTSLHGSLVQGADFIIMATDVNGLITTANRKLDEMLGYTPDDVISEPISSLLGSKYITSVSANVFQTFKHVSQGPFDSLVYPLKHQSRVILDADFTHKNGDNIQLQLTISAITDDESKVLGYLFLADDVRAQKALKLELELVNSAVYNSEDILLWLNDRGEIFTSNPYARKTLGYSEYELKRLNIMDILPFDIEESWQSQFNALHVSASMTTEKEITKSNGKTIPCLISVSKLNIEDDVFLFLSAKDISDRLEKERVLEDALNLAAQANLSKDQFLANMGHELRTPLNEVNGSLQLLQLTDLSVVQSDYLSQAKASVRALTQSIDNVLDCGEIIRNKLAMNNEKLDLFDLINSVGQASSIIAEDKNIEVHFDIADNVPSFIHSDPHRLYQLLMCLMNNAIKFTFEGDVVLRCALRSETKEQYEIDFEVIDSGVGISEEQQTAIFELFSQAQMGSDRAFGGLGLGLTISKTIVELMSGHISCKSNLGVGSTFRFTIKADKVASSDDLHNRPEDISSLNVLVVDDNDISLSVLSKLVEQLGWNVVTAKGANDAVEKLNQSLEGSACFDLALIDWNMPEKSGLDLVKDIRDQFNDANMPILVMVTAYTRKMLSQIDNRDVENLLSAFLTKPVTRLMLIDLVRSVLGPDKQAYALHSTSKLKLDGFRVLLVEDNETNQFIAKNLLKSQGAIVAVASEGQAAWKILNEQPERFDIVLMDIQMPGWDGYRTTKEIRADARFSDLPILAMTANVLASDKRKCFDVGMNGHIGKPFELTQLVQEILSLARKPDAIKAHRLVSKHLSENSLPDHLSSDVNLIDSPKLLLLKEQSNVNIEESLKRFGGSEILYLQSMTLFIKDLEKYRLELTESGKTFTKAQAKALFHTLKGTSSLLGFKGLANLAMECEQLASLLVEQGIEKEPFISITQCMQNTQVLLESLFGKGANDPEAMPEIDIKVSLSAQELQEFRQHLKNADMQSEELYSTLKPAISSLSKDLAVLLEDAIAKLDFTLAIKYLDQIEQQYSELIHG